ncbi:hypothetical protein AINA4_15190 [Aurantimicrobium sp. INA4]|nr:hypothetical protein AINA4_15190 [Aurantimicrobium sp. INA4]
MHVPSEEAGYFRRTDNFPSLDRLEALSQSELVQLPRYLAVCPPLEQAFASDFSTQRPLI